MDALRRATKIILMTTSILIAIGIVMIYSSSSIYALDRMGDSAYFLKRQLLYLIMGGALGYTCFKQDLNHLRPYSKKILIGCVVLMVLVLIPHVGQSINGARRWFKVLGFSFQPSEFLKLALIFYMADFLDRKRDSLADLRHTVMPALVVLGLCAGLVFLQPDLGTAITLAAVAILLFFVAGFKLTYLGFMILAALPALAYAMLSKAYRRKRILAFLNPWEDPRGVGFQIIQSFLALGSGGLFGVGLGRSQQKLFYLPESHTDFIFSIIGEELGFIGTSSIVILFLLLIVSGMVIVFRCRSFFTQLLCLGLVGLIGFECVINIGVTLGALPTKGLSLPFISYGGSALIGNMMVTGLILNIARQTMRETQQEVVEA